MRIVLDPGTLISIVQNNYTTKISRNVTATFHWSQSQSHIDVVDYCSRFYDQPTSENIARCYSAVVHSIRNHKMQYVNNLESLAYESVEKSSQPLFERMSNDFALFPMSYLHWSPDADASTGTTFRRNICIFGEFSFKLSVFVLMSSNNSKLWLFLNAPWTTSEAKMIDQLISIATYNDKSFYISSRTGTDDITTWKNDFEYIENEALDGPFRFCDVFHFRGDQDIPSILSQFQPALPSADTLQIDLHYPIASYVIYERSSMTPGDKPLFMSTQRFHDYSSLVDWEYSIKWPSRVGIFTRTDPHGYLQQFFDLSFATECTLMDTWVGSYYYSSSRSLRGQNESSVPVIHYESNSVTHSSVTDCSDINFAGRKKRIVFDANGSLKTVKFDPANKCNVPGEVSASHNCENKAKRSVLIFITYTNQVFGDNALGLQRAIQSLNVAEVVTSGDFNYYDYRSYLNYFLSCNGHVNASRYDFNCPHIRVPNTVKVIQIAIGAHEPTLLLKHYIVFDVEQIWSLFMSFSTYEVVLRGATAVFTMSKQHSVKLQQLENMDRSKFYNIPLYTKTLEKNILNNYNSSNTNDLSAGYIHEYSRPYMRAGRVALVDSKALVCEKQLQRRMNNKTHIEPVFDDVYANYINSNQPSLWDESLLTINITDTPLHPPSNIDILFYGSCSDRRRDFLSLFEQYSHVYSISSRKPPLKTVFRCLTKWTDALVDEERDYFVKTTKLYANIHTVEDSSLEIHRITYLLSLGKCVVSERSVFDPELDKDYEDAIIFGDNLDDVAEKIIHLLAHPEEITTCEERAKLKYEILESDVTAIGAALHEILQG